MCHHFNPKNECREKVWQRFIFPFSLDSAYANENGEEPAYTTWKIREDGEHIQTLDYMFHSKDKVKVTSTLEFPTEEQLGEGRVPSHAYASDHFSLVADFVLV